MTTSPGGRKPDQRRLGKKARVRAARFEPGIETPKLSDIFLLKRETRTMILDGDKLDEFSDRATGGRREGEMAFDAICTRPEKREGKF
jgi:hypothetical protein